MCDHRVLNRQVEEVLRKSKKSLQEIRKTLSNRKHDCGTSGFDYLYTMRSSDTILQTPPLYDKELMIAYTKNLVDNFISQNFIPFSATKETIEKRDEAVMVKDIDFESFNKRDAEMDSFNVDRSYQPELKAEWKPIKNTFKPAAKSSRGINIITPRSTRTARLRAELSRQSSNQLEKGLQKKKIYSIKKPPSNREIMNKPQFNKFIKNPNWNEKSFFQEHPHISVVYNESETVFPKRVLTTTKIEADRSYEKKENESKNYTGNINETHTIEHDNIQSNKIQSENYIDGNKSSTWHEVLLERNVKKSIHKAVVQKENKHILHMKTQPEIMSTEPQEEDKHDGMLKTKSNHFVCKKFIDLGSNDLKVQEKIYKNTNNLSIKNLPVLYIKGECQIQKSFSVNIEHAGKETDLKNIKFEQFVHGVEKGSKENNYTKVELKQDLEERTLYKNDHDSSIRKERLIKQKANKYLSPFIDTKLESDVLQECSNQTENDSDSYVTMSSTSAIRLDNSESKESSSQTDDQKIKSKTKKVKKKSKIGKNVETRKSSEILNILEDAMLNAIKKLDELPELKLLESESDPSFNNTENKFQEDQNLSVPKPETLSKIPQLSSNDQIIENLSVSNMEILKIDKPVDMGTKTQNNISNDDYINKIFKKIYLDEPEGLKTFKNMKSLQINSNHKSKDSDRSVNKKESKKKVCTVSVGCNTDDRFSNKDGPELKNFNKKQEESSSSLSSSSPSHLKDLINSFSGCSFKSTKHSPIISPILTHPCDSCLSINNSKKGLNLHCDRSCNFIDLESEYCPYKKSENAKSSRRTLKYKNFFDNLDKRYNICKKNEESSKKSLNLFKLLHTNETQNDNLKNLSGNSNKSSGDFFNSIPSHQSHKVQNRLLKPEIKYKKENFHRIKNRKVYDQEVKRAVKNFLTTLDTKKSASEKCKNVKDSDFEIKLSDILLISSSLSSDSSLNTYIPKHVDKNKPEQKMDEQNLNPPKLQRSSTFIIENDKTLESFRNFNKDDFNKSKNVNAIESENVIELNKSNCDSGAINNNLEIYNTFLVQENLLNRQTSSSTISSLSLSYNKMETIISSHNNIKQIKSKDNSDKENFSDGEIPSIGEI